MKARKSNYAVYNIDTGFRLTEYASRGRTIIDYKNIIKDTPNLKGKVAVKQKGFEKVN